jgi:Holliday junction resolvase
VDRKSKGRRREWQTVELLQDQGYVCTRAAGSKGLFDVIAINGIECLLIQCKSNRWPSKKELAAIRAVSTPGNCRKLIHRWVDGRTQPDVKEI